MHSTFTAGTIKRPGFHVALWWWLVPVLLLAFWLGAQGLDSDAIWNDEYFSIRDAGGPPYGPSTVLAIWERVATGNPWHAPGFFIMLSGWGHFVGWQPPALRAFALLAGMLGIAWTYRLGRDHVSSRVGLYGAAILGTSAFFAYYLHELRMYTLFVLFIALTFWAYLHLVDMRRRPHPADWIALFLGALGLLYTHYYAGLPVAGIVLYHAAIVPKNRRWWQILAVFALAGLLFLPWLGALLDGMQRVAESDNLQARALSPGEILEQTLWLFGNTVSLAALAVFGLALWAAVRGETGARRIVFFAAAAITAIILTNAVMRILLERRERYLMSAWPLLALAAAVGLVWLRRLPAPLGRIVPPVLLLAWLGLGIATSVDGQWAATLDGGNGVFPVHRLARALRPAVAPEDVIVSYWPDGAPSFFYRRDARIAEFYFHGTPVKYVTGQTRRDPNDQAALFADMHAAIGDSPRLWLAYRPNNLAASMAAFREAIADEYVLCQPAVNEPDLRVDLYARSGVDCAEAEPSAPGAD